MKKVGKTKKRMYCERAVETMQCKQQDIVKGYVVYYRYFHENCKGCCQQDINENIYRTAENVTQEEFETYIDILEAIYKQSQIADVYIISRIIFSKLDIDINMEFGAVIAESKDFVIPHDFTPMSREKLSMVKM